MIAFYSAWSTMLDQFAEPILLIRETGSLVGGNGAAADLLRSPKGFTGQWQDWIEHPAEPPTYDTPLPLRLRLRHGMELFAIAGLRCQAATPFLMLVLGFDLKAPPPQVLQLELRDTKARLQTIVDSIPALISYVDHSEKIAFCNRAYSDWFGWREGDAIGRSVADVVGTADYAVISPHIQATLAGQAQDFERTIHFPNGSVKHVNAIYHPEFDEHGAVKGFYVLVRDISEQKIAEAELHAIGRQQATVAQLGQRALLGEDLAGLMADTVQLVAGALGVEMCEIYEYTGQTLLMIASAGWERGDNHRWAMTLEPGSQAEYVLKETAPVVSDLETERRFQPMHALIEHQVKSSIDTAIQMSDGVYGLLGVHTRHARHFAEHDVRFIESVANVLAAAVQRRRSEDWLFQEKERAQITVQSIGDSVVTLDRRQCIESFNPAAEKLTGWARSEALGQPWTTIINLRADQVGADGFPERATLITRHGAEIPVDCLASTIHDSVGGAIGSVLVMHDITEHQRVEQRLTHQAAHDPLTGLANRREFISRLEAVYKLSRRSDQSHALCFVDLDRFKMVNDLCGHAAGDELLRQVSQLLQTHLRKTDLLARLGGDEFAILLLDCDVALASRIAELLVKVIADYRFLWDGKTFSIGVSVGLQQIDRHSPAPAELLHQADTACYLAKQHGRGRLHTYSPEDEMVRLKSDQDWATSIEHALANNGFVVHYQPIMPIQGGNRSRYFEVLVRLRAADGMIMPGTFMAAAERQGLASAIDRWVVGQVLQDIAARNHDDPWICTINLAAQTLTDLGFLDYLAESLRAAAVPPGCLCFEISEITAFSHLSTITGFLRELKALGCGCALDQFGCGMTVFSNLKALPVDFIKMDGKLIKDLAEDPLNRAMVEAIKHIGHAMGIKIIAGHTETDDLLNNLQRLGVDYVQGFAVHPPASASDMPRTVRLNLTEETEGTLSVRQKQIVHWLKQGKTNWEVARILGLTEKNVKYHVEQIYVKLGAKNRAQAVAKAISLGLIDH